MSSILTLHPKFIYILFFTLVYSESEWNQFKSKYNKIYHTIEEENEINLNRIKNSAIEELDNYLSTLNEEDFTDVTIYELVQTRINSAKIKIFELEDETTINKLVEDTISSVEDAKK